MSIIDKQILTNELRNLLSDKLPMVQLETVQNSFQEILANYDVARNPDSNSAKDFSEMIKLFVDTKRIEGRSEKSLKHYNYVLERLNQSLKLQVTDISVIHLRKYLSDEKLNGSSDVTLDGYRRVFSSFFGWLCREGMLKNNPCSNLNHIKCQKKIREPYSDIDLESLKEKCVTARDKAIVSFLNSTGCRISEICSLNRDSVDLKNCECVVLGKGNKERTVYFDNVTALQIKRYLDSRVDNYRALFVGRGTARMSPDGIRKSLKSISDRANVDNVHPHRFRRTLATDLINHGMPVQDVAKILGHENINTTMKYVYIDRNNIKTAYRKYR